VDVTADRLETDWRHDLVLAQDRDQIEVETEFNRGDRVYDFSISHSQMSSFNRGDRVYGFSIFHCRSTADQFSIQVRIGCFRPGETTKGPS